MTTNYSVPRYGARHNEREEEVILGKGNYKFSRLSLSLVYIKLKAKFHII